MLSSIYSENSDQQRNGLFSLTLSGMFSLYDYHLYCTFNVRLGLYRAPNIFKLFTILNYTPHQELVCQSDVLRRTSLGLPLSVFGVGVVGAEQHTQVETVDLLLSNDSPLTWELSSQYQFTASSPLCRVVECQGVIACILLC